MQIFCSKTATEVTIFLLFRGGASFANTARYFKTFFIWCRTRAHTHTHTQSGGPISHFSHFCIVTAKKVM